MADRLQTGTILGNRFEIQDFLGAGSFGEVYDAQQTVFGHAMRNVALKLFTIDAVNEDTVAKAFSDVVAIVRLLEDDAPPEVAAQIVQILDLGIIEGDVPRAYMTMRLVPGTTLDTPIRRARETGMEVNLALHYLDSLLRPLAWIHHHNFIHGDLKPDNLLLDSRNEVVITDFGLAAHMDVGVGGGAVAWQAPEVLRNVGGEAAADVYSVGVILYQMLTGRHPFDGVGADVEDDDDGSATIKAHIEARAWPFSRDSNGKCIRPPEDFNPHMRDHPQITALLMRCLNPSIDGRFANAGLLKRAVEAYRETGNVPITTPVRQAPPPGPPAKTEIATDPVSDALALHQSGESERGLALLTNDGLDHLLARARIITDIAADTATTNAGERFDEVNAMLSTALKQHGGSAAVYETLAYFFEKQHKLAQAAAMRKQAQSLI